MGLVLKWTPNGAMFPNSSFTPAQSVELELENTSPGVPLKDTKRIGTRREQVVVHFCLLFLLAVINCGWLFCANIRMRHPVRIHAYAGCTYRPEMLCN